jgi:hypothetical protein
MMRGREWRSEKKVGKDCLYIARIPVLMRTMTRGSERKK